MKKHVLTVASMFLFVLLAGSNSFAQSADDYVRNTTTAPDVTASGWVHDSTQGDPYESDVFHAAYTNNSQRIGAVITILNRNGQQEELIMLFGSGNVVRAAIKVEGIWYVAKAPFIDYTNQSPENYFTGASNKNSQGVEISITLSLDTLEGLKSIVVDNP